MKAVIAWFAGNHVAANLLMGFFLLAGAVTATSMKMEVVPEIALDRISITTEYPGASPAEVEESVVRQVEDSVAGLAGIKRIDSVAREGVGSTVIEVMQGWDLKTLLDDVKAEVARIKTLPEEAEKPVVQEVTKRTQVISVAVYGDTSESTLKHLAERIRNDLTDMPGITLAELSGVRKDEIHIEISEQTLRRYDLTLGQVAEAVKRASLDLPAGSIKTEAGEILLRTKGRRYYAADYRDVAVITRPDGSKVTLGQIAQLKEGFEDVDLRARFQGKPAAVVQVFRVADQNALTVADSVKRYLNEIGTTLPTGVNVGTFDDMSGVLRSRISLLLVNMAYGLILVSVLLGLFLSPRLAFWVTMGVPVAFLSAMYLFPWVGVSVNMVSLFALILVLGIVVDDATVIGENVFRKREEGLGPLQASIEGTAEVARPVIFSSLTTIAAFWPLLFLTGTMGKLMRDVPWVVILVLLGSLMEALLILPSHLARSVQAEPPSERISRKRESLLMRGLKWVINGPYAKAVETCVKWRYATVALAVAVLLVSIGTWRGGWIRYTYFPKAESDEMVCSLTMPAGTSFDRTLQAVSHIENAAQETLAEAEKGRPKGSPSLFKHSLTLIGEHTGDHDPTGGGPQMGGNLAQVSVQLLESEKRKIKASKLASIWREKVGSIPGAESITFRSNLFSPGNPVEVHLSLKDNGQLLAAAEDLKGELKRYPGLLDVEDSYLPGKKEMQLKLKPTARSLGLSLNDLAQQVRNAFYGAEALRIQRDQDEVRVLVRYPEAERKSLGHVEEMRIRMPDGSEAPFGQVAEVKIERGYAAIERAQRLRVIKITADVDEAVSNANQVRMDLENRLLPQLRQKYPGLRYVMEGQGKEQKESMADVVRALIIAAFCIYALLAIPFRSFSQPFIVMSAIPFGMIGAIVGHLIMGLNFSVVSLFGLIGLAGVVVNDSLVLVDAANEFRKGGDNAHDAVTKAGVLRFRAVLLTSVTTFAGLAPMIFERSLQAQFLIPMAVSLGFGVLFATGVTLLLVPCGYMILEDFHRMLEDKDPVPSDMERVGAPSDSKA